MRTAVSANTVRPGTLLTVGHSDISIAQHSWGGHVGGLHSARRDLDEDIEHIPRIEACKYGDVARWPDIARR